MPDKLVPKVEVVESEPMLTPQHVARMVGLSASQIRTEIQAGELKAKLRWSRNGKQGRYLIARADAEAYIARLDQRGPRVPQAQEA